MPSEGRACQAGAHHTINLKSAMLRRRDVETRTAGREAHDDPWKQHLFLSFSPSRVLGVYGGLSQVSMDEHPQLIQLAVLGDAVWKCVTQHIDPHLVQTVARVPSVDAVHAGRRAPHSVWRSALVIFFVRPSNDPEVHQAAWIQEGAPIGGRPIE